MGAGGVVLLAPGIQGGLEFLDRLKRAMHIQQFSLEGLVEAFDLPGGGRGVDLGEPVSDPVLPADPVKQHLHRHAGLVEPAGEHLAVVGQHLLGHPVDAHRVHERLADWAGGGPHHRLGDHAEPGMVIDPGDDLDLGATGEERAGSHIQLPQLHRGVSFPPPVVLPAAAPGLRLDQPVVDQRPVDRGAGHLAITAAAHLKHQPPRPPLGMPAAQLTDRFLDLGEDPPGMLMDPVAAVLQPGDAFLPDRKSTRLNSSHVAISYAVFCLKKKKHQPPVRPAIDISVLVPLPLALYAANSVIHALSRICSELLFFFNDPATPEIYTLSLHDALPISRTAAATATLRGRVTPAHARPVPSASSRDRKSTRLNSSHVAMSYAVFCLKKKKIQIVLLSLIEKKKNRECYLT